LVEIGSVVSEEKIFETFFPIFKLPKLFYFKPESAKN
jgi:hypothetical protein